MRIVCIPDMILFYIKNAKQYLFAIHIFRSVFGMKNTFVSFILHSWSNISITFEIRNNSIFSISISRHYTYISNMNDEISSFSLTSFNTQYLIVNTNLDVLIKTVPVLLNFFFAFTSSSQRRKH